MDPYLKIASDNIKTFTYDFSAEQLLIECSQYQSEMNIILTKNNPHLVFTSVNDNQLLAVNISLIDKKMIHN